MAIVIDMKADRIMARANKDHDKFATLTNVIGDFDLAKSAKSNLTKSEDEIMIPILKLAISQAKNVAKEMSALGKVKEADRAYKDQILLESYVPEELDEDQLTEMANEFKIQDKKMPDFMKHLRENYANQFNGKKASDIAKSILS